MLVVWASNTSRSRRTRGRHPNVCACSSRVRVDATKCARGIDALKLYRAEYDDRLRALRPHPVHDWNSTWPIRYLAMTLDGGRANFYGGSEYRSKR